nr:sensor domain-containing protein [Mycobacterium genavense]
MAVIAAIAIVVVMTTQSGKTKPAPRASNSNSAPAAANSGPAGNAAKLESYLVGAPEVGAIVGDPSVVAGEKISQLRNPKWTLTDPTCAGTYEPAVAAAYQGAGGLSAVRGLILHTPEQDPPNRIIETVAEFSSPDQASAFVQQSADKWRSCAGKTVTETLNGNSFDWAFADVTGTVPKIASSAPGETTSKSATTYCTPTAPGSST